MSGSTNGEGDGMGERLTKLRVEAGFSRRELSELAGLSPNQVQQIETKVPAGVEARTVLRLADVFGASMDWLFAGRGPGPNRQRRAESVRRARRRAGQASS